MTYPPQMMKRKTAAQYCDMSEAAFEREVIAGRLPQPVILGGRDHWHRPSIDKALSHLAGDWSADWRKDSPLYAS